MARKRATPKPAPKPRAARTARVTPARVVRTPLQVRINAAPPRVWDALVTQTARWWPADFCAAGPGARMTFEPRVGGRMFEDAGEGRGVLWGLIQTFSPPHQLDIVAHLAPAFGGPATSILQFRLRADGSGTLLDFEDALFGRADDGTAKSLADGWRVLLGQALKAFAEARS